MEQTKHRLTPESGEWVDAIPTYVQAEIADEPWFWLSTDDRSSASGFFIHRDEVRALAEYAGFEVTEKATPPDLTNAAT